MKNNFIIVNLQTDSGAHQQLELVSTLQVQRIPKHCHRPFCLVCGNRKKPQTLKDSRDLFIAEWSLFLNRVKAEHPAAWQVYDVEKRMRQHGWHFQRVPTAEVSY